MPAERMLAQRQGHRAVMALLLDQLQRQGGLALAKAAVGLLQRNHVGVDLAQHRHDPLRIAAAVKTHGFVDVITGESELHQLPAI